MNCKKNIDFFKTSDYLIKETQNYGVEFSPKGYPVLRNFKFIGNMPDDIELWPYSKRNQSKDRGKTVLVFYEGDDQLYSYLNKLPKVAEELQNYYAVCGFDLSPCVNDTNEQQEMALLINTLVNAYFLVNGICVIPSLRTGDVKTFNVLQSYPKDIVFSIGAIGCSRNNKNRGLRNLITKIYTAEPSEIISYGFLPDEYITTIKSLNIPVFQYPDYRYISYGHTSKKVA